MAANAVLITISGAGSADGQWEISTVVGTSTALLDTLDDQVWYGDEGLADQFTTALADGLGYPNGSGTRGPAFLVCYSASATCASLGGASGMTAYGFRWNGTRAMGFSGFKDVSLTYAVASRVASVPAQLEVLREAVTGIGPGSSLSDKVAIAEAYYAVPDLVAACGVMDDFINHVRGLLRGRRITDELAGQLIEDAVSIKSAMECE